MAMISWPFDSTVTNDGQGNPIYTKTYSSDVLANILQKYFRNGVFNNGEDSFQVLANSGMDITVSPGHCLIQGRHGYNEAATTLTINNADPALPRIDLVVLRLNLGISALSIDLFTVTGTAAVSPVAPSLTRNSTVYELGLAKINVGAGVTAITQAVITDTRLDNDRCGVVASVIGDTNTSNYYAQIAADLAEFKADREADFDAWFASVVSTLGEDEAGNLLNQINALDAETVKHSEAQGLTNAHKKQARDNIYAATERALFYTNPSPTSEWGAWKPGGDLSGYQEIEIEFYTNATLYGDRPRIKVPMNGERLAVAFTADGRQASRIVQVDSEGVLFQQAYIREYNSNVTTINNVYMVPYRIWGIMRTYINHADML